MGKKRNAGILLVGAMAVAAMAGLFGQQGSTTPIATATPSHAAAPATEEADLHQWTPTPAATSSRPASTHTPSASRAPAGTATPAPIVNSGANLRAGPGTSFAKIGALAAGKTVVVAGRSVDGKWLQLEDGSWIAAFLVDYVPTNVDGARSSPSATRASATTRTAVSTPTPECAVHSSANLRAGPGTNFPTIGGLPAGAGVNVIGRSPAGDWLQLANGSWIASFLVDNAPKNVAIAKSIPTAPPPTMTPIPSTPTRMVFPTASCSGACCYASSGARYGAICADGWSSGATGRGACSHHGGVARWLTCP